MVALPPPGWATPLLLVGLLAPAAVDWSGPLVLNSAAAVVVAAAVLTRRRAPEASLALATSVSMLFAQGEPRFWPLPAAILLSYLAGHRCERLWPPQAAFAAVAALGLLLAVAQGNLSGWLTVLLIEFFTAALPWWAGSWRRQRAELARAGWERAQQAERERELVADQARLRERARIAQDMHDALGHELSLIALLAGGLEVTRDLSSEHREGAKQLREGAVSATERLHEVIGVLRTSESGEAREDAVRPDEWGVAAKRMRRSLVRGALLPAALALGTASVLVGAFLYTSATTTLHPSDYANLRIGQSRAEIAGRLPSHHVAAAPPVLERPAVPAGAKCEYYQATAGPFAFSGAMYRLCFTDGILAAKHLLRRQ